jgi:hypothetical protein
VYVPGFAALDDAEARAIVAEARSDAAAVAEAMADRSSGR